MLIKPLDRYCILLPCKAFPRAKALMKSRIFLGSSLKSSANSTLSQSKPLILLFYGKGSTWRGKVRVKNLQQLLTIDWISRRSAISKQNLIVGNFQIRGKFFIKDIEQSTIFWSNRTWTNIFTSQGKTASFREFLRYKTAVYLGFSEKTIVDREILWNQAGTGSSRVICRHL